MQLIKHRSLIVLLFMSAACNPEVAEESDWMLGTFSNVGAGYRSNSCGVGRYEILEDGTFIDGGVDCDNDPVEPKRLTWERLDENTIEIALPSGDFEAMRIRLGKHCNVIEIVSVRDGVALADFALEYVRGAVCHERTGPCEPEGSQCEGYITVWCDEPPPPCEDDAP